MKHQQQQQQQQQQHQINDKSLQDRPLPSSLSRVKELHYRGEITLVTHVFLAIYKGYCRTPCVPSTAPPSRDPYTGVWNHPWPYITGVAFNPLQPSYPLSQLSHVETEVMIGPKVKQSPYHDPTTNKWNNVIRTTKKKLGYFPWNTGCLIWILISWFMI